MIFTIPQRGHDFLGGTTFKWTCAVYSLRELSLNTSLASSLYVWTYCMHVAQRVIGVFRKERSSPQIRLH